MPERRVLWASTAGPGGIHDLLLVVQQTPLWTEWHMRHIATHRAGNPALKVAVFARGAAAFAVALVRSRPDLVHLHAVDKRGSRFRNSLLAWMSRLARVPVIFEVHGHDTAAEDPDLLWRRLDARYREVSAR